MNALLFCVRVLNTIELNPVEGKKGGCTSIAYNTLPEGGIHFRVSRTARESCCLSPIRG